MLVLSRKSGDSIVVDGRITIHVVKTDRDNVKIGVEAPRDVPIFRKEIYDEIRSNNRQAAKITNAELSEVTNPLIST